MNAKKHLKILFLISLLTGCAAPAPKLNIYDSQAIAGQIIVKRDDFQKSTDYIAPNIANEIGDILRIRAWKFENTSQTAYQIYVADYYYGDWRFYKSTFDSNGNRLDTTLISRKVESCSRYGCYHTEHLGINVTKDYLEKNKETGITFKVSGTAGEAVFSIPGAYIQAILNVVR